MNAKFMQGPGKTTPVSLKEREAITQETLKVAKEFRGRLMVEIPGLNLKQINEYFVGKKKDQKL